MPHTFYQVLHVVSVILLSAFVFQALASADPARRKQLSILSGIASLVAVVAGVGLLHKLHPDWTSQPWVYVKLGCWLLLSGMVGLAYRFRSLRSLLTLGATALVIAAVYAVYVMRF